MNDIYYIGIALLVLCFRAIIQHKQIKDLRQWMESKCAVDRHESERLWEELENLKKKGV
jgi:hypothetical protein